MSMFPAAPRLHRGPCWRNQLLRRCCKTISPSDEVTVTVTDLGSRIPWSHTDVMALLPQWGAGLTTDPGQMGARGAPSFLAP